MQVDLDDKRRPRFTGYLRRCNLLHDGRSGATAASISEQELFRRHGLLAAQHSLLERTKSDRSLSWAKFESRMPKDGSMRKMRDKYDRFLELCAVFAGDEEQFVGDALQEVARDIFDGFTDRSKEFSKLEIQRMLGVSGIKKADIQEARALARDLQTWSSVSADEGPGKRLVMNKIPYQLPTEEQREKSDEIQSSRCEAQSGLESTSSLLNQEEALMWLGEKCMLHVSKLDGSSALSGADLSASVRSLLASDASDEHLQGQLFDLLGMTEGTFDFIGELLAKRSVISKSPARQEGAGESANASIQSNNLIPAFAPSSRPSKSDGRNAPRAVRIEKEENAPRVALPNLKPGARPAGTKEERMTHLRLTGPCAGSQGDEGKAAYVQVHVPPPKRRYARDEPALIPTSEFGSLAQVAFQGIKTLNRLQSAVFHAAYNTSHNLLVCAPTGAGKTNVAMTTVVREIERNSDDIHAIKIIYVAPMKALAQEVVEKFGKRLNPLGIKVRELTGDMQLSRSEIENTQLIVTTPEKWDVITRKSGDGTLVEAVNLLIIDEVHLLGEDRGPVIEALIARTLRLVEQKQKLVRIVGLSATLPNYQDVARFLRVDLHHGMFFFDNSYRPVPLDQAFIGIIEKNFQKKLAMLNDLAFLKAAESVRSRNQVMIFVHSRKDTGKTARALLEAAKAVGDSGVFKSSEFVVNPPARNAFAKDVAKSRNSELRELFAEGIGIHHAGMLRPDRTLTERMFSKQAISILCCTATLAWGVNLPAHTVIIKGTQVYVAEKGGLVELNMQDVFQCFGRAGRPQYDNSGEAILITEYAQLNRYLSMLNHALPLESHLDKHLPDALNAEIVSGTVTNLEEGAEWLSCTFLFIRMMLNPLRYGITHKELEADPYLLKRRAELIVVAARQLDSAKMSRFALSARAAAAMSARAMPDLQAPFGVTDMGRIASHFYIGYATIEEFNEHLKPSMNDEQALDLLCRASEFQQIKTRDEEAQELRKLVRKACALPVLSPPDTPRGKTCILFQAYITRTFIQSFTLSSDMMYISQNMGRVARAVFEICLKKRFSGMAEKMLAICTALEKRCWWPPFSHPLRQFVPQMLSAEIVSKIEDIGEAVSVENMLEMDAGELGALIRHQRMGPKILRVARCIPYLHVEARLQPLTRSILRVSLEIHPDFEWTDRMHGSSQSFWFWVDDQNSEWIYHAERFTLRKSDYRSYQAAQKREYFREDDGDQDEEEENAEKTSKMHPALASLMLQESSSTKREFTIPIFEPLPPQYYLRVFSEYWLGSEAVIPLSLNKLVLPPKVKQHTDLLPLSPLPRSALRNPSFEKMYERKFTHFNPIQTQIFHVMYHTDENVLLGAPTGSGKTISSELAMLRVFSQYPRSKVVYIAPLKALVSERSKEWQAMIGAALRKRVVEFTGDVTPDPGVLRRAEVLITTPEKWDGASRMWTDRSYIKEVRLVIIDEIHLLGEERGAVLEVLVTRMRYIAETTGVPVRIVGLSTALANAHDLANWLGIEKGLGLYNFRPAVRPVPLEAHIQGFPGKAYCPRMASMNKPAYQAILMHSPRKPVLIFVASRRQTRLTALDLIALCASSESPRRFLHMPFEDLEALLLTSVDDGSLQHTLAFGIGLHHAGLSSRDRELVERLFVQGKVQVLVCTSTLAWGVNFPAHLIIIKGTEYFDAKTKRYQPFPITDVLQMMGRAGRPQFDDSGVAMIFVEETLKDFYKKFLYEPFPVESHLPEFLHNHLNAEIAAGSISSEREALDYLSWTFFFRRLPMNPSYYGLDSADPESVALFLIQMIREIINDLARAGCVSLRPKDSVLAEDRKNWQTETSLTSKTEKEVLDRSLQDLVISSTQAGRIASFYYLDYRSIDLFSGFIKNFDLDDEDRVFREIFVVLSAAHEYCEVPVRHNEELLNQEFADLLPWSPFGTFEAESPHCKTFLMFQAHCQRVPVPIKDYIGDTKSVLDQALRILNALVDLAVHHRNLRIAHTAMIVSQCVVQGRWWSDSALLQLPKINKKLANVLESELLEEGATREGLLRTLQRKHSVSNESRISLKKSLQKLPVMKVSASRSSEKRTIKVQVVTLNFSEASPEVPFHGPLIKSKRHTWWILVCDPAKNVVLHCKHFIGLPKEVEVLFELKEDSLSFQSDLTAMLVSGSVKGLDVQLPVGLMQPK